MTTNEPTRDNLLARLQSLASDLREPVRMASVHWEFSPLDTDAISPARSPPDVDMISPVRDHINKALANCDAPTRLGLTVELFELWQKHRYDTSPRAAEAKAVFGVAYDGLSHLLIATLSGNKRQLRVWHGMPGGPSMDHIDSAGDGLLFGVYGSPDTVLPYVQAIVPRLTRWGEIEGRENAKLWM